MNDLKIAAKALKEADALLISAGAGMGVDSGLPDFRGNEGFWKAYPPIAKLGISFTEMANPQWFKEKPELAWAFYGHRLNLYRKTKPHKGFQQLLKIAKEKEFGYFVYTSNVDGQFQKAGYSDDRINEVHGSIHHFQCSAVCDQHIWAASEITVKVDEEKFVACEPLPKCPECGAVARPNILMFGDWYWIEDRSEAQSKRYARWLNKLNDNNVRLAIIEIGAGKAVPTVRLQSSRLTRALNATLIRINPRDFDLPKGRHYGISSGAAAGIQGIVDAL